jgi:hypothetical protein
MFIVQATGLSYLLSWLKLFFMKIVLRKLTYDQVYSVRQQQCVEMNCYNGETHVT